MNGELEKHEIVEDAPVEQVITEDFIAKFEKQAELYQNRYLPICLKLTNENDWVSHAEGKFYLQSSGAEKICNPLGIVWEAPIVIKHERKDDKGDFYEYEIQGIVNSKVLKRYIWTTGNCSSRDQFFIARGNYDEGDIRKSAFSNWLVNAVTRLAGIRNPTAEMLGKAGLKAENIKRIDYSGRKTPEADSDKISDAQFKRLWAIAKKNNVPELKLNSYLSEKHHFLKYSDITRGTYDEVVKWAENYKGEREAGQEG